MVIIFIQLVELMNSYQKGVSTNLVNKVAEGSPHVVEFIKEGKIDMIINTTENKQAIKDSFTIRRTAVDLNVLILLTKKCQNII